MPIYPSLALNNLVFGGLSTAPAGAELGAGTIDAVLGGYGERAAYPLTGKDSCRLQFTAGSSELGEEARVRLAATWDFVRADATLREVLVLAYADADYPRTSDHLSRADRELAQARGVVVRDYLDALGAPQIDIINMAKRAHWLQSLFLTGEAQLKRSLEVEATHDLLADGFYQELGAFLEVEGGPGRVVVVVRKDRLYAH